MGDLLISRNASRRGCITREHIIAIFHRNVAGKASFVQRLVARLSARKVSETPAARRGILLRILHHELHIHRPPNHQRFRAGKWNIEDLVVIFRRDACPMKRCNDGTIRERERSLLESLDRDVVAELSAQLLALAGEMELIHGDQLPIAIAGGNFNAIDRGGVSIGLSRRVRFVGDNAGNDYSCKQQETDPLHSVPPLWVVSDGWAT